MEEVSMESIDERLIVSDPAAGGYRPRDLDAMISRVVATPALRRDAAWRSFRLKVAAAVTATSVLTGAGIAALSTAGVSLPVLSLAAAASQQATGSVKYSAALAPTTLMRMIQSFQFTGADSLPSVTGSAAVYVLSAPTDPAATLAHAATVLGVDIGTPISGDNGRTVTSLGPAYSGTTISLDGYASWSISENHQQPITSSTVAPATDNLNARALAWAGRLTSLELGAPSATPGGFNGADVRGPIQVSVPVLVDHRVTDLAVNFIFNADGTLLEADGVDFALSLKGNYPLLSPAAGASQITSQLFVAPIYFGWVAAGSAITGSIGTGSAAPPSPGTSGAASTAPAPPGTVPPDGVDTTSTTLPPTVVVLDGVTPQYDAYEMADGSALLLPVFVYTGYDAVTGNPENFRVISVDPTYLDLSMAVTPQIY
jgi:hypothetical protein